jgi:hypothetical protein
MKKKIISAFAMFIVIYIAIHIVSQSAVFSTYPETLNTAPVNPPIVLQDPGVSGVSVSLGVAGASANVTVLLPYSLTILQDVIYYTTFDSGLPTNWVDPAPACWTSDTTTAWVGGSITCSAAGAYEVAYYNSSIVSNTMFNIHIGAYVMLNNLGANTYAGVVLYNRTTGEYYFAAVGNGSRLNILKCAGGTCTLVVSTSNLGLQPNTWYFLYALWTSRTSWREGGLTAALYRTDNGEQIGYTFFTEAIFIDFDTVGIAAYNTQAWIDELAISRSSTLAVSFSGVPSGWVVKIYNDTVLVNQGVSPGSLFVIYIFYGTANSHNSTILRSGRIEVYDNLGNLRASRSEVIVTGRVYQFQGTGSFDNRVLNIVNVDSKPYYGLLSLRSPASYSRFSTLQLYLCNPSGCSTALNIIAGSTSTSEIVLPASQTSYIRLVATPSASGASANIQIWLQYSTKPAQNAAIVRYPINIVIR